MDTFAIKLCLTPAAMLGVSLAARRYGSLVGGLIAGLPLTSGPISIYLAIEQGPIFAARAALGGLAGTSATLIAYAVYVALTRRCRIPLACLGALAAFVVVALAMLAIGRVAVSVAVGLVGIAAMAHLTRAIAPSDLGKAPPLWDLPARLTISTAMVLAVTGSAGRLGAMWSGAISPIPVVAWPLIVFAHAQGGRAEAMAAVRGTAAGAFGIVLFYLVVAGFVVGHDLVAVYGGALGAAVAISLVARRVLDRHARFGDA